MGQKHQRSKSVSPTATRRGKRKPKPGGPAQNPHPLQRHRGQPKVGGKLETLTRARARGVFSVGTLVMFWNRRKCWWQVGKLMKIGRVKASVQPLPHHFQKTVPQNHVVDARTEIRAVDVAPLHIAS
jgi:hypothetical protein